MDRQPRPRFEPPPPAMSAFRESRIISAQMAASSSASAAEASSRSELSIQQAAQSTARTADDDDADDADQTSTATFKFGAGVPAATTSNTVATPTDSNGSTITNLAASTSQPNTLSTSPSITSTATSDRDSDFPHRGPQNTGAAIQTSSKAFHAGGPSPGQIAAAVVIPLLFLIALVFAILFLRRRRRRSNVVPSELQQQHHHPMADRSGAAFAKEAAYQSPRHVPRPSVIAPILTTTTNNTYYTGLSTPSTPSRTTSTATRGTSDDSTRGAAVPSVYDIPPPAYAKLPPPGSTPTLPQLSFPADPFMDPDPVSPLNSPSTSTFASTAPHTNAALAALSGRDTSYTAVSLSPNSSRNGPTPARPDISRAGTMRSATSVTSDMYSDTASVHSAKPARMSGAPNLVVGGAGAGGNWLDFESGDDGHRVSTGSEYAPGWVVGGHGGDPFRDPR